MITYLIILVAVIALAVPSVIIVNKRPETKIIFQVIFGLLIIVFGVLLYLNIGKPIKFERELNKRTKATVQRLIDVRTIQIIYKDKYGKHISDFDTLISFVKSDSIEIQSDDITGVWNQDEMTKEQAYDAGILVKKTSYVPVFDSLWKDAEYPIEDIRIAPLTDGKEYTMDAGKLVTGSKVKVNVFECYISYIDLLIGLDDQLISNYIDEKTKYGAFAGVKVGSLTEATNHAGNWEQ